MRKSNRQRPWFIFPLIILSLGVVAAGYVFYRMINAGSTGSNTNTNQTTNRSNGTSSTCGNGVCENVACTSLDCPVPESVDSCPADCSEDAVGGNDIEPDETNANTNANTNTSATLEFSSIAQTLSEKTSCPVEEANMSPADAVAVAAGAGLVQGTKDVEVSLALFEKPLEQCVWSVKNYLTSRSGKVVIIVDSTQDVYRSTTWK